MNLHHSASAAAAFAGYGQDLGVGRNSYPNSQSHHLHYALTRQRSFHTKPSAHYTSSPHIIMQQTQGRERRSSNGMSRKQTLEIYRPPNVREEPTKNGYRNGNGNGAEANTKLNVHAKEFTMSPQLHSSKSSGNLFQFPFQHGLQHSKSSGNVLHNQTSYVQQQTNSSHKVHFATAEKKNDTNNNYSRSSYQYLQNTVGQNGPYFYVPENLKLKRSKSMNDALKKSSTSAVGDLGSITSEMHSLIQKATQNPNELPQRHIMTLAKFLVEKAVESREYSTAASKLCATIIEKSRTETFVDSLFNTCQYLFKERERLLRVTPSRYPAFMAFLYELYTLMKSREQKLKTAYDNVRLLTLIASCLLDCVSQSIVKVNSEIESLFFVFTSVGQDLEVHLPSKLDEIVDKMRIQFLKPTTSPNFRKTLLQMIELRASKWALPVESIIYYYPGNGLKK